MRKLFPKIGALWGIFLSNVVLADGVSELQLRLEKVANLSAHYEQVLYNADGKVVQKGAGEIQLKRPNLFRVASTKPQENLLVSDGKNLWFYDPFVEQVTIHSLKETLENTPFMLLTSKEGSQWKAYQVSQKGNVFTLTPILSQAVIQTFVLDITPQGKLNGFATTEKSGQRNVYTLNQQRNTPISDKFFYFTIPDGAEVDDQRK